MHKLDGEIKEVNEWMDGAERKMDEIESQGPNDGVLKVRSLLKLLEHVPVTMVTDIPVHVCASGAAS